MVSYQTNKNTFNCGQCKLAYGFHTTKNLRDIRCKFVRIIDDTEDEEQISNCETVQLSNKDDIDDQPRNLTNVKLFYLPLNTTTHLQPMDAGIIRSFKANYKQLFCRHLVKQFNEGAYDR